MHEQKSTDSNQTVVGLDIGGTKTALMIKNKDKILIEATMESTSEINRVRDFILKNIKAAGLLPENISALAAGVPGRVDTSAGTVIDAPAFKWRQYPITEELCAELPFSCVIENDIIMALIAEVKQGKARGLSDAVFMAVGTGLGSAIMAGGRLITGSAYSAGEIGYCLYNTEDESSLSDQNGSFGSLERQVSGYALSNAAQDLGIKVEELYGNYNKMPEATEAINKFLFRLSVVIANLICTVNPQLIVIGGGVSESLGPFLPVMRKHIANMIPISAQIELSSFRNRAGALGACLRAEMLTQGLSPSINLGASVKA